MDIIASMFSIAGNVTETDREYKMLSKRLQYLIQKSDHLLNQKKMNGIPPFVVQNFKHKRAQAKQYLEKINHLLASKSIPLKQKIKLSLPFNKTSDHVKKVVEQLERALQDISQYTSAATTDFQQKQKYINNKRPIKVYSGSQSDKEKQQQKQSKEKKKQIQISNEEIDEGLQQQFMGPTIEEDQAIQFTKNKYISVTLELMGKPQIIGLIESLNPELLKINKKQLIKFQNEQKKGNENYLKLLSINRIYFKSIYGKLKLIYPDVDRISKSDHFVVYLKRSKQELKAEGQKSQKQSEVKQASQKNQGQQFFSFPDQTVALKQKDQVVIQRANQKSIYIQNMSSQWQKVEQIQRLICNGDRIATFLPPNLYYKIKFTFDE